MESRRDCIKRLGALSVPLIFSQIGQVMVMLVDNIMVGQVGSDYLAAAALANSLFMLPMTLGIGIAIGLTPLVGERHGRGDINGAVSLFHNSMFLNTVLAVTLTIVSFGVGLAIPYMKQSDIVVELATDYYYLLVCSLFPMMLFFTFKQFAEGFSNTRMAMYVTISANVLNVALNYILIYGKLGFPQMDLNGAGLATLISRLLMPLIIYIAFSRSKFFFSLPLKINRREISMEKIKLLFSVGGPIGSQMLVEASIFSLASIMIGWIGPDYLAAHQIASSLSYFTFMLINGVSQATTIRVSYLLGKGSIESLKQTVNTSYLLVFVVMSCFGLLFLIFRDYLPYLFVDSPEVIEITSTLLIIVAVYQVFDGTQVVGLGIARALSDVKWPMIMAIFSYLVVGIPSGYLLAFNANLGIHGVWCGFVIGLCLASILFYFRVKKRIKIS